MCGTVISVKDLKKSYGSTSAVDGISFELSRGMIMSILGPNGAGKTTSLECIEGLLKPDSGTIQINGRIGVQLQNSALPEALTVSELVKLFCVYRKVMFRNDLIKRFGLEKDRNKLYRELSTGRQRRLALALSLIHNPEILILDEPSAGLDVESRTELHRIILEMKDAGTSVILATHDMAEAEKLSDRIIIMLEGRIITEGSPREITARGGAYSRFTVRTEKNSIRRFAADLPFIRNPDIKNDYSVFFSNNTGKTVRMLMEHISECGDRIIDLRIERPSLEERFIELTGSIS